MQATIRPSTPATPAHTPDNLTHTNDTRQHATRTSGTKPGTKSRTFAASSAGLVTGIVAGIVAAALLALGGCDLLGIGNEPTLETTNQRISYSLGYRAGQQAQAEAQAQTQVQTQNQAQTQAQDIDPGPQTLIEAARDRGIRQAETLDFDPDEQAYSAGIRDALNGEPPRVNEQTMNRLLGAMQHRKESEQRRKESEQRRREAEQRQAEEQDKQAADNAAAAKAFLAENANREGVQVTDSGLQYQIITMGDGPRPGATDTVEVHYRGTLLDGTEFDSSHSRGQPASFAVGGVIAGWTEALQMMPVGSKWKLFLPPDIAYGARSVGQHITPNSALIFEVELLAIK